MKPPKKGGRKLISNLFPSLSRLIKRHQIVIQSRFHFMNAYVNGYQSKRELNKKPNIKDKFIKLEQTLISENYVSEYAYG